MCSDSDSDGGSGGDRKSHVKHKSTLHTMLHASLLQASSFFCSVAAANETRIYGKTTTRTVIEMKNRYSIHGKYHTTLCVRAWVFNICSQYRLAVVVSACSGIKYNCCRCKSDASHATNYYATAVASRRLNMITRCCCVLSKCQPQNNSCLPSIIDLGYVLS